MLILNGSLETVRFGYNSNAKNPKEGGNYTIQPNETIDIPEEAKIMIDDPNSTPYKRGIKILGFGADRAQVRIEGLKRYIITLYEALENEHLRTQELEQVGRKFFGPRPPVLALEAKIKTAEEFLKNLEESNGDPVTNGKQSSEKSGRPTGGKSSAVQHESHP